MLLNQNTQFLLDVTERRLERGHYQSALDDLYASLLNLRESMPADEWREFATGGAVEHPLRDRIHADPMHRRSFDKPRGYAGDAVLLDYLYGIRVPCHPTDEARAIYEFGMQRPAVHAVRRRRERIAELIDETAARLGRPIRVLSIAAGHARELHMSKAYQEGQVERFVALDSDRESCETLADTFPDAEVLCEPFTALFKKRDWFREFDLVYSSGLFDYLEPRIASKLATRMFDMLAPGGSMAFTNFLDTTVDAGFMETYMGWELLLRSVEEPDELVAGFPESHVARRQVSADSYRTVGYVRVDRA